MTTKTTRLQKQTFIRDFRAGDATDFVAYGFSTQSNFEANLPWMQALVEKSDELNEDGLALLDLWLANRVGNATMVEVHRKFHFENWLFVVKRYAEGDMSVLDHRIWMREQTHLHKPDAQTRRLRSAQSRERSSSEMQSQLHTKAKELLEIIESEPHKKSVPEYLADFDKIKESAAWLVDRLENIR